MTKILMSVVATTMLFQLALAVDYNVGAPNGGWDTSTDLQSWSSAGRFLVGDNIEVPKKLRKQSGCFCSCSFHVWWYPQREVTKAAYDSCSTSSPMSTNRASPTTFALTDIGIRYFICGTADHCQQGMKVEIRTFRRFSFPPPGSALPPSTDDGPRSGYDPDDYAPPEPDSAATVKIMTVVSMVGFAFLLMI
ncbi:cupredoxin superfamily protein [Artemisia annua]|uniref:Cupredoxin superfamily protein n=1 Tax=Artemisia annua TaxID=35608 RepID=A0A2U1KIU8_ARTAN|nr:cupredoxin superfamily protein [Artemisia annua]